jgi:phage-related protein
MKVAAFHPSLQKILRSFPKAVRREFGKAIFELQGGIILGPPLCKAMPSVGKGVSELRIKNSTGIYRAFYLAKMADEILIFHAFQKKTQKTPQQEIEIGKKRLREMLDER